ncbi:HPr kinase/phosphorylase [Cohnella thailandensis]|uniref:Aldolase n=1 Tax=Cohnella thailandensis TaxID=557557 RepID=A0A841SYX1_9BACL|nr:aldolase [Cohnella thailandensis]MBB6635826.1 aldolase [Cohnella thailandensis]MBP1976204.1 hypothetical protein [Cohnella thailandensis]
MNDALLAVSTATLYRAFGLRISSRIPLPELPPATLAGSIDGSSQRAPQSADIGIDWADPGPLLAELKACGSNFSYARAGEKASGKRFLFLIPDTAVYAIEDGRTILVAPLPGADPERVRVYLLGTCMGALLLMRRVLPLHGSAVVIDGKAYAFLGDSGAGKSTLAAACASLGHRLVSDDVVAVALDGEGRPFVQPAYPQQKLWRESLEGLGMDGGAYRPIYRETEKFAVPATGSFLAEAVPLAGVFELAKRSDAEISETHNSTADNSAADNSNAINKIAAFSEASGPSRAPEPERIAATPVAGLEKLRVLMQHTYRNRLIPRMGLEGWHFRASAAVAARIEANRLRRPRFGFTALDLAQSVIHNARRKEWEP